MIQRAPQQFTAFLGHQRLASGPLAEVALAVMKASKALPAEPILIFDDANGRPIDLDLRGTERDVVARLPPPPQRIWTPPSTTRLHRSRAAVAGPNSALSRAR